VDDGYYASVGYMRPGLHTLHFAAATGSGFSLDVTYQLTVVRADKNRR
jgi:hypothetical protein